MKFLNGWAILWILLLILSILVSLVGGFMTGQLNLFGSMAFADLAGTSVVSLVLEAVMYLVPER